ncbi:hypothetical protein GQ55_1G408600 [Panicum hallii var. hallii]|uniref:Uncharacterized protein n=1 Tax=Panicum hallii var. hallii TaxID=1504633 RepID=A0A2T7FCU0_9POAL|nr:hypothetical protein GQ55_1G408600 [Panicum hallii var. hallii]
MGPMRHPLPFPFLSSPATLSSPVLASLLSIPDLPSPPPSPAGPSSPSLVVLARQRCGATAVPGDGARRPTAAAPHAAGRGAVVASIGSVTRRRGTPAAAAGSRGRSPASIRRRARGPGWRRRPTRRRTATTRRRRRMSRRAQRPGTAAG